MEWVLIFDAKRYMEEDAIFINSIISDFSWNLFWGRCLHFNAISKLQKLESWDRSWIEDKVDFRSNELEGECFFISQEAAPRCKRKRRRGRGRRRRKDTKVYERMILSLFSKQKAAIIEMTKNRVTEVPLWQLCQLGWLGSFFTFYSMCKICNKDTRRWWHGPELCMPRDAKRTLCQNLGSIRARGAEFWPCKVGTRFQVMKVLELTHTLECYLINVWYNQNDTQAACR